MTSNWKYAFASIRMVFKTRDWMRPSRNKCVEKTRGRRMESGAPTLKDQADEKSLKDTKKDLSGK